MDLNSKEERTSFTRRVGNYPSIHPLSHQSFHYEPSIMPQLLVFSSFYSIFLPSSSFSLFSFFFLYILCFISSLFFLSITKNIVQPFICPFIHPTPLQTSNHTLQHIHSFIYLTIHGTISVNTCNQSLVLHPFLPPSSQNAR